MKIQLVLAATAAAVVTMTGTAHASVTVFHGSDWAQVIGTAVRAYDGEADGNGVYADFVLRNGAHGSVWDGNGADGTPGPLVNVGAIAKFRVCEDHAGCSAWHIL